MFSENILITRLVGPPIQAEYTGQGELSRDEALAFRVAAMDWFKAGDFADKDFGRGKVRWFEKD